MMHGESGVLLVPIKKAPVIRLTTTQDAEQPTGMCHTIKVLLPWQYPVGMATSGHCRASKTLPFYKTHHTSRVQTNKADRASCFAQSHYLNLFLPP
jgi:hypothetical protein